MQTIAVFTFFLLPIRAKKEKVIRQAGRTLRQRSLYNVKTILPRRIDQLTNININNGVNTRSNVTFL